MTEPIRSTARRGAISAIVCDFTEAHPHANQTKMWAVDPDGRQSEVYTVHDDTDEGNGDDSSCCSPDPQGRSCCS